MSGLLQIQASCTPVKLDENRMSVPCAATIAVAPGVKHRVLLTVTGQTAVAAGAVTYQWVLIPGQPGVTIPAPATGSTWSIGAETILRIESINGTWALVGLALWGVTGWQLGTWLGRGLERRRLRRRRTA